MNRLRQYCEKRLPDLYQPDECAWADRRLQQELKAILTYDQIKAFEDAQKSAQLVRDQGLQCRLIGAGCSSLVSYLLGLSDIDPMAHGLLFERFLEANELRTIQFQFVANFETGHVKGGHLPFHDRSMNCTVRIQQSTPFESLPGLIAEEIQIKDRSFHLTSIPLSDETANEVIRSGDIDGFRQFESLEARRLLSDIKPTCLTEIAVIKAILIAEDDEPGSLDNFIQQEIEQKQQTSEEWQVKTTLVETRGIILFQEQIMFIMNRVADIPPADAYTFIKAVCKRQWEKVTVFRDWFVVAAVGNGVDEQKALTLFENIRNSAARAICKAHHISEAMTVYQVAFLKAHFPREFDRALKIIEQ